VSDERLRELLPLAALGVLDGDDRAYFEIRVAADDPARRELQAFEEVVARIAFDATPVPPTPELRTRLLDAAVAGAKPAALDAVPRARPAPRRLASRLAFAALVVTALGLLVVKSQRDEARREGDRARLEAATAAAQAQRAMAERDAARVELAQERAFRALVAHPESRVASLAGLPPAPKARARVVWNPARMEAVLLASGLAPAPEGKAYEVWAIAQGAPVPAGVFQVASDGSAMVRLSPTLDLAPVRTFAVTVEPAAGVPAPTGPMVLAGAAS
jgi:anti-sigma-K factor RskA